MIPLSSRDKPAPWAFARSAIAPRWRDLWRGCRLAWPLWSRGVAEDTSGQALHGTPGADLTAAEWVATEHGLAPDFAAASTDKISVSDPTNRLDNTDRLSADCLVELDSVAGDRTFLNKYRLQAGSRSWRFFSEGTEVSLQLSSSGSDFHKVTTSGAGLTAGVWHHLAFTYLAGAVVIYVDGRPFPLTNNMQSIFGGDQEFKIAQSTPSGGGSTNELDGRIAGVRVWVGRVLAAGEILRLMGDYFGMWRPLIAFSEAPLEHSGSAGAGPWMLAGSVAAGAESFVIAGLTNGVSYDVQAKTEDESMNESSGSSIVAGTPTGETSPRSSGLRYRRVRAPGAPDGRFPRIGR